MNIRNNFLVDTFGRLIGTSKGKGLLLTDESKDKLLEDVLGYDKFSETKSYNTNDICIYNDELYKFTNSHTGEWSASDVVKTSIEEIINSSSNVYTISNSLLSYNGQMTYAELATQGITTEFINDIKEKGILLCKFNNAALYDPISIIASIALDSNAYRINLSAFYNESPQVIYYHIGISLERYRATIYSGSAEIYDNRIVEISTSNDITQTRSIMSENEFKSLLNINDTIVKRFRTFKNCDIIYQQIPMSADSNFYYCINKKLYTKGGSYGYVYYREYTYLSNNTNNINGDYQLFTIRIIEDYNDHFMYEIINNKLNPTGIINTDAITDFTIEQTNITHSNFKSLMTWTDAIVNNFFSNTTKYLKWTKSSSEYILYQLINSHITSTYTEYDFIVKDANNKFILSIKRNGTGTNATYDITRKNFDNLYIITASKTVMLSGTITSVTDIPFLTKQQIDDLNSNFNAGKNCLVKIDNYGNTAKVVASSFVSGILSVTLAVSSYASLPILVRYNYDGSWVTTNRKIYMKGLYYKDNSGTITMDIVKYEENE